MNRSSVRVISGKALLRGLIAVSVVVGVAVPAATANATTGRGTFTKITSPNKDVTFHATSGAANTIQISGGTSADVTEVSIVCITPIFNEAPEMATLASGVTVTGQRFSAIGTVPTNSPLTCRLRAIPTGVDVESGAAYTGPLLRVDVLSIDRSAGIAFGFTSTAGEGDGFTLDTDAGNCGVDALVSLPAPTNQAGPIMINCAFAIPPTNATTTANAPTASAIKIDGHSGYLPDAVHFYLIDEQGLAVAQSSLSVGRTFAANGDVAITESAPVMRCSVADTFPPTTTSCPSLISSGVTFKRVSTFTGAGHQVTVRDSYTSTDHAAHTVAVQYTGSGRNNTSDSTADGEPGYTYPGHGTTFTGAALGSVVTGLGTKLGSMFIRSDLYAATDDPDADTAALTWSRGPSKVQFSSSTYDDFALPTTVSVPAGGVASTGFTLSERLATADVTPLATAAGQAMLPTITVTAPTAAVKGTSTTVKGQVTAGANGLPTTVTVAGHPATLTVVNATTASYSVTFTEATGSHSVAVVATDAAGNTATKTVTIVNS